MARLILPFPLWMPMPMNSTGKRWGTENCRAKLAFPLCDCHDPACMDLHRTNKIHGEKSKPADSICVNTHKAGSWHNTSLNKWLNKTLNFIQKTMGIKSCRIVSIVRSTVQCRVWLTETSAQTARKQSINKIAWLKKKDLKARTLYGESHCDFLLYLNMRAC